MNNWPDIPAPRPITVKVQRLSAETMAECERAKARIEARERAEFEAHADLEASREFTDDLDADILT
jgi:hypothetical protein